VGAEFPSAALTGPDGNPKVARRKTRTQTNMVLRIIESVFMGTSSR
jgi:hypothetical protein